jgi:CRP/FNR family transcriptional regulator
MQYSSASFLHAIPKTFLEDAIVLHFAPGDYIKRAGDSFDHFCILQSGSCKLVYEAENTSLIIDIYHEGDFFGEMEAIGMQTTDRSLIALTDCEVLRFTKEQFRNMWSTCSDVSMYIFAVHCKRLMQSGNDKIDSECMFLREKVFRLIQQNLNEQNYFMYTKDILAEMAGVSMRSLNRSLSELKQLRLISISSGAIRLQI